MKNNTKHLIKNLPGPKSYCNCNKLCSPLELEHVMPEKVLIQKLQGNLLNKAFNDPHNIYNCCRKINRKKSYLIPIIQFKVHYFNGILSRSCLYMNDTYNLGFDMETINRWKVSSLLYEPSDSEIERSYLISTKTIYAANNYIRDYPYSCMTHYHY